MNISNLHEYFQTNYKQMADKLERIDINNFTVPFTEYSKEFMEFAAKHKINLSKLNTLTGQGIALLTCEENRNKYALRNDLEKFYNTLNMETEDAIQCVNKCNQWGLKRLPAKGIYCIPYPFEYDSLKVEQRKNNKILGDRNEQIDLIKKFIKTNYLDVPNEKWQVGHKDPTKADNTNNLIYQPPIQGKYRDRYKFDNMGLTKTPTVKELSKNINKYYTKKEQEELLLLLQTKLNIKNKETE